MRIIKIILILFIFAVLGCAQNLKIVFDAHPSADNTGVEKYIIYKFEGDSINGWSVQDMDSIGTLPHVINYSGPYEFETYFTKDKILRAGAIAEDSLKRQSAMGLSKFYYPPDIPQTIRIEEP